METVKLARLRAGDFTVNYDNGMRMLTFKWIGYKKGRPPFVKDIPQEVFDYLNMSTCTFTTGELAIAEQPKREEIVEQLVDAEAVEANTHSYDEIQTLLKGNINKMKSELKKITDKQGKRFVMSVFEDVEDELPVGKSKFIREWSTPEFKVTESEEE